MKKIFNLLVFLSFSHSLISQVVYFADGYHGGIYGHYPMWQTQFMVDKLKEFPEWRINLELEPETWDSVQIHTPEAYMNFKKIATDARIEFTNPAYAQPYLFNISGESIIRHFQYGIRKIQRHFPGVSFETYSTEEPCFTSALPQLLRSFGFKYAVLKNPDTCWGGYVRGYGKDIIQWVGSDGTKIPAVPRYANEAFEKNSTWQTQAWNNSDDYLQSCFDAGVQNPVGMCYQDAGWKNGPWVGHGKNIKNHSVYTTWRDYFSAFLPDFTDDFRHLSQEDIQVSLMWGSQVLQRIAQQVRQAENTLIVAEKMLSMASLENGQTYPHRLMDDAWRTLLLAQHHDVWIVPYNRLKQKQTWADAVALWTENSRTLSEQAIRNTFSGRTSFSQFRVYNTLPEKRTEIISIRLPNQWIDKDIKVVDPSGKSVESFKQINGKEACLICKVSAPPFGYTTLRLEETKKKNPAFNAGITFPSNEECLMENDCYKITFDLSHGGIIKSLIAKKLGNKEFVDKNNSFGFNELRGYFYEKERFISNHESPARITILEDNPLRKRLKIESIIDEYACCQIITLNQSQERIDFSLLIDWDKNVGIGEYRQPNDWQENRRAFYDDRFKLNVLFPTHLSDRKIYKDAPFDVCESRLKNTFYNRWDSIKNNIILHWVDVVQGDDAYGLALFSDHTTSYSHGEDFPLGLTAQYSGKGLWGEDYNLTKPLSIEYALIPHQGKWSEARIGYHSHAWNEKMGVSFQNSREMREKSFLQFDKQGYELTSLIPDEENHFILRIFNQESDGQPLNIKFCFPITHWEEIKLNGEIVCSHSLENAHSISLSIPSFGIKTIRIQKHSDHSFF
ncbi:MAG: alpha-mannosidase [Dysgonamonadaceae bacterium]|jgi:alpha-mannosidase|nr:alpha-mannosidase [Dysgonamonadaceae bacterium]